MGITEGIIKEFFKHYGKKEIVSSSRKSQRYENESRAIDTMDKTYLRLQNMGFVFYDAIKDVYYHPERNSTGEKFYNNLTLLQKTYFDHYKRNDPFLSTLYFASFLNEMLRSGEVYKDWTQAVQVLDSKLYADNGIY